MYVTHHMLCQLKSCQLLHKYKIKKLCYCRGTAQRTMLVNSCYFQEVCELERFQTAKVTFKVIQGYWQQCHLIGHIRFSISVPLQLFLSCTVNERYEILSLISQNLLVLLWFQKFCCRSVSVGFARKTAVFGSVFVCPVFPCRQCGTFMRPTAHQTCSTLHNSVYNSSRQQQVSNSV